MDNGSWCYNIETLNAETSDYVLQLYSVEGMVVGSLLDKEIFPLLPYSDWDM